MFLTYTMLFVALCLSAVAAFYSIIGLTAIFAAAVVPIIIMGSILEIAKVTVTIWLHEYWGQCKRTMKLYLVPAVFVLMVLTSMGIFGFLSKAHLDQTVPAGDIVAQVSLFDEKIKNERDTIANARTLLAQLDKAVNDISSGPDKEIKLRNGETQVQTAAERALQVRRQQARDRAALIRTIEEAQSRIVALQEERAPIASEARKIEAEVGPVKYVAALIYGDQTDVTMLERAVRWVIILIVAVFDPLAIMMLLAATESLKWERERRAQRREEEINDDSSVSSEPPAATIPPGSTEPEEHSGAQPDQPTDSDPALTQQSDPGDSVSVRPDGPDGDQPREDHRHRGVEIEFIEDFHEPDWPEPVKADAASQSIDTERPGDYVEIAEEPTLKVEDDLDWSHTDNDVRTYFGRIQPRHDINRGDLFLKINALPTLLYKFNGEKWIEIDKKSTNQYLENQYIDFLIRKISTGEYDPELLNDNERECIQERLQREI